MKYTKHKLTYNCKQLQKVLERHRDILSNSFVASNINEIALSLLLTILDKAREHAGSESSCGKGAIAIKYDFDNLRFGEWGE